ncbi:MAG: hypothetical protein CL610_10085 [Anaerolineaceae bacterium]|nr:hypothetical protein [Anaerolineaceae bacterium]
MPIPKPVHIETQDLKYFAFRRETYLAWTIWAILSVLAGLFLGAFGVAASLIILAYLLLSTMLKIYHKLQVEQVQHYWQTEALFSLYSSLKIEHPLPPMRLWAASPDFVILAVSLIREHQPAIVLEVGSGVSTIVSAYALKENGSGQLISLEHEENFSQVTAANLATHQLDGIASVRYAPLKPLAISGQTQPWYDTAAIDSLPGPINLLVVDGPPSGTATQARYPALPMLFDQLAPGAYVLVDDFMRDDEYTMVNRWLDDYNLKVVRTFANEKGAAILQKTR